jgi:hypothetical protein
MDERFLISDGMIGREFQAAMQNAGFETDAPREYGERLEGFTRIHIFCGGAAFSLDLNDCERELSMEVFCDRHVKPYIEELKRMRGDH